ncbi:acyl-CoA thioesterase-2 [Sinomonas atrocyanea]|uniref:acyl-CoA thioesterase n=1 Tax=Sinomonas atrocyanea TaxID=37927 RepID=UPI002780CD7E|nr:acyl-CoA thioesterase domain-containing protein [Sinomonas atrocyanea]MDP9882847.1 acyl-CoA thioesterase-2 [Sinomonas atrocyanea]
MLDRATQGDELSEEGVLNAAPLVDRLRLEPAGQRGAFKGMPPQGFRGRLFGGHLLGQAVLAAGRTVDAGRAANSIQAYFVAPGIPGVPITYEVETLREGASFSLRALRAVQGERLLLTANASFVAERQPEVPLSAPMPDVPAPEELPPLHERRAQQPAGWDGIRWPARRDWETASRPMDIRYVEALEQSRPPRRCFWFRMAPVSGADANTRRAMLAFASDRSLLPAVTVARGDQGSAPEPKVASVDHAMWFHGDAPVGSWCLYVQESPVSTAGLGLARGLIYGRGGQIVASVAQQGVFSRGARAAERVEPMK